MATTRITPPTPCVVRGSQRLPATITGRNVVLGVVYAHTPEQSWALTFDAKTGRQIGGPWVLHENGEVAR